MIRTQRLPRRDCRAAAFGRVASLALGFLAALAALAAGSAPAGAQSFKVLNYLRGVEMRPGKQSIGLRLNFKRPIKFKSSWVEYTRDAIQIDIPNAYIHPSKQVISGDGKVLKQIDLSQLSTRDVRLRLFTVVPPTQLRGKLVISQGPLHVGLSLPLRVAKQSTPTKKSVAKKSTKRSRAAKAENAKPQKTPKRKAKPKKEKARKATSKKRAAEASAPEEKAAPSTESAKSALAKRPRKAAEKSVAGAPPTAVQKRERKADSKGAAKPAAQASALKQSNKDDSPQNIIEALLRPPGESPQAASQADGEANKKTAAEPQQKDQSKPGASTNAAAASSPADAKQAQQKLRPIPELDFFGAVQKPSSTRDAGRQPPAPAAASPQANQQAESSRAATTAPPRSEAPRFQLGRSSDRLSKGLLGGKLGAQLGAQAGKEGGEQPRIEAPSLLSSSVKMASALAILLGILLGGSFVVKRYIFKGRSPFGQGKGFQLKSSHYLGAKKSVAVVEVEGQVLVLGVTPTSINLLTNLGKASAASSTRNGKSEPESGAGRALDEMAGDDGDEGFDQRLEEADGEIDTQEREEESLMRLANSIQGKIKKMKKL